MSQDYLESLIMLMSRYGKKMLTIINLRDIIDKVAAQNDLYV